MDKQKFNLKYLFKGDSENSMKDWFKSWGLGWRLIITLAILFFVGITIWRAFFMKTTSVTVQKGGTANIYNQPKRFFIPFIEGGVEQRSDRNMGTYIRAGLRIEW